MQKKESFGVNRLRLFIQRHKEVLSISSGLILYGLLSYFFGIPCPIKEATGVSCPGCGMSRALIALLTLDFSSALYYHPVAFVLLPMAVGLIVFHERGMKKAKKVLLIVFATVMLAVYLYRFLVIQSPVLEFAPEKSIFTRFWS
jgi:hypothetical protein